MSTHQPHKIRFPLEDVEIHRVDKIREVEEPVASNDWMSINADEFSMRVEEVGDFYAREGNYIEYSPDDKADEASLELFMNGSVYGAILHQRRILPLHGSSFIYNQSGVMVCGESGAGKSSLTASFCLNGAGFMTDDVTPILFEENRPHVWPKSGRVKLWDDSLEQLQKENEELTRIRPEHEKYYFPLHSESDRSHPLHFVLILRISDTEEVSFERVEKAEAFSYLHQEIYRREFLMAMRDAEAAYLQQISAICNYVAIYRVQRPDSISISKMQKAVADYLSRLL